MKRKTNNPNGRPKGKPNRITSDLRAMIKDFLTENYQKVTDDFQKLDPKDRVKVFVDLLQYAIPKYQSVEMDQTVNDPQLFVINVLSEETKKLIESGNFFEDIE